MGRGATAAIVTALAMLVAPAAAASPSAKLVYLRGAGADACPDEGALRRAVGDRVGYDPFFAVAPKTVVAEVTRAAGGYRARVQIVGDDGRVRGERDLSTTGEDCGELVGAIALAISVALDDLDEPPPEPPSPPPAPQEEPPAEAAPSPAPAPMERPAPRPPGAGEPAPKVHLSAALGPTATVGAAPSLGAGGALAGILGRGALALRLDARADLPSGQGIVPVGRVSTASFVSIVSACIRGRTPFGCLGAGGGVLLSSTEGLPRPASDSAPLALGVARFGVVIRATDALFVEPSFAIGANLARHRVEVDGRTVFELPLVFGSGGALVGLDFF